MSRGTFFLKQKTVKMWLRFIIRVNEVKQSSPVTTHYYFFFKQEYSEVDPFQMKELLRELGWCLWVTSDPHLLCSHLPASIMTERDLQKNYKNKKNSVDQSAPIICLYFLIVFIFLQTFKNRTTSHCFKSFYKNNISFQFKVCNL